MNSEKTEKNGRGRKEKRKLQTLGVRKKNLAKKDAMACACELLIILGES